MDASTTIARPKTISQNRLSPLFRLPLEIRHLIYELCFIEQPILKSNYVTGIDDKDFEDNREETSSDAKHNHARTFHGFMPNWVRPGCTVRTKIFTELLRTCKLVQSEASVVLNETTAHRCYQGFGPQGSPTAYFKDFTKSQLSQVRRLHLFTQVTDFDKDGLWLRNALQPVADNLKHLKIIFRDLGGAPDKPMLLNPFREGEADLQDQKRYQKYFHNRSGKREIPEGSWGATFVHLPALQSLVIEMEDQEARAYELEELIEWAKGWTFPLSDGNDLVSNTEPTWRSWRRPQNHSHRLSPSAVYQHPRIITWAVRWDAITGPDRKTKIKEKKLKASQAEVASTRPRTRAYAKEHSDTRIERPAYNPCLGGLNSIYAHASDESLKELIEWGIL